MLLRQRRVRRDAVGRNRRVRPARHDLRLLAYARRVDPLQRSPARSVTAVRSWTRRLRARRRRVDADARARRSRARARGARVYATIDGYASTCDAYHRVQMDPDGEQIVRCMSLAIERSGRPREEVGYINYHGTSTQLNDAIESRCTRAFFGTLADRVPGSSTKSMIGHPQGASGAAGVVAVGAGAVARLPAADHQPPRSGPGLRSRLHSQPWTLRARRSGALQLPRVRIEEQRAGARSIRWMTSRSSAAVRRDRWQPSCWRAPARACACSIDRPFLAASCAATRSIQERWRFSRGTSRPRRCWPQGLPIDGMLLTGPGRVHVRGRYRSGLTGLRDHASCARRVAHRPGPRRRCAGGRRRAR